MTTPSVYEDHAVRDALNSHVQAALWCDTHGQTHGPCVDQDGSEEAFHAALAVMDLPELDTELTGAEDATRQAIMDQIHERAGKFAPKPLAVPRMHPCTPSKCVYPNGGDPDCPLC